MFSSENGSRFLPGLAVSAKLASNSAAVELSMNSASETSRSEIVCLGAALTAGILSSSANGVIKGVRSFVSNLSE